MQPIERLMKEHRLIEKALEALAAYADFVEKGKPASREDLGRFVDFVREFSDAYHHGKEEDILFRAMMEHGMPADGGPIGVMLHEHDLGRGYIGELAESVNGQGDFSDEERTGVVRAARDFVSLLENHIKKEDNVLYPMSRDFLPAPAWDEIGRSVEDFEKSPAGSGKYERYSATVEQLVAAYCR